MKVIGLTGGAGSGKTYIGRLLTEVFGCTVLCMDDIAREQMMPGGASYEAVVTAFGRRCLQPDQTIDRAKLAAITMGDNELRARLNALTHPFVLERTRETIKRLRNERKVTHVIVETALLLDCDFAQECDEIWYVYCSRKERAERLRVERAYSTKRIKEIFAAQRTEREFRKSCTHVIDNGNKITKEQLCIRLKNLIK